MKSMIKLSRLRFSTASAGAVALLLAGCAGSPPPRPLAPQSMLHCDHAALQQHGRATGPAIVAEAYGAVSDVPLDAVTVLDRWLFNAVMTQSIYSTRTGTGTVEVTVRFANCTDRPIQMRARTSFLRPSRAPAEATSAWTTLFLEPHALAVYQEKSVSTREVEYFLIELAPAD